MLFVVCFGLQMMPALFVFGATEYVPTQLHHSIQTITLVLAAYIWVSSVHIFRNMRTKEQRINYLMLPATDLEKWLARVAYIFIVFFVGGILVFVVSDLLRMGIYELLYGDYFESATASACDMICAVFPNPMQDEKSLAMFILFSSGVAWVHSYYLLGGTLFRKLAFIFSSFVMFVMWLILAVIVDFMEDHISINICFSRDDFNYLCYAVAFVAFSLTVIHYWLSYKIFHHMQVINNKWLNIL